MGGLRYSAQQMFLLRVGPHRTRQWLLDGFDPAPHPLSALTFPHANLTRVVVMNRDQFWTLRGRRGLQCLTADNPRASARVTTKECQTDGFHALQTFLTVQGNELHSIFIRMNGGDWAELQG